MNRYYDPADDDITFSIGCYKDYEMAEWCISELRKHYPSCFVHLISDGDDDIRYYDLVLKYRVTYIIGERLYPAQNGGALIHRILSHWAEVPTKYLIKIDTDTHVHRRFDSLPDEDCLFGSLQSGRNFGQSLQGGCLGMTRNAAYDLWYSEFFLDEKLKDYKATWAKNQTLIDRAEIQGLIGFEWVMAYVLKESGLPYPMIEEPEIRSEWRKPVENKDLKYAVTHPCQAKLDSLQKEKANS